MTKLSSIEAVVEALGGADSARLLAGLESPNAAFNWIARGKIPPDHFWVFSETLRASGKEADPALFGFAQVEARA